MELKQLQASHPQSWHTLQLKENHSIFLSQYNFHTSFRGIQWLLWSCRTSLWRPAKAKGVQTHSCPSHRSLWSCRQHVGLHCTTKTLPWAPSLPPTCAGAPHLEEREQSQGYRGRFDPGCNSSKMPSPLHCPGFPPKEETFSAPKQFIFGSAFWTKRFTFDFRLKVKAQPLWMENK